MIHWTRLESSWGTPTGNLRDGCSMSLPNGTTLGPYEILAEIGSGGMGEVYRARDSRLERDVAVKVLSDRLAGEEEALSRFRRESTALAALSHPNILSIYDIGTDNGSTYAIMELLEGDTLAQLLSQSTLDWPRAVDIGLSVAEGLTAAHDKGIVHRDIKPRNIFMIRGGGVKILDFGLMRYEPKWPLEEEGNGGTITSSMVTQPGMIMGTASYMSPEQVRGRDVDHQSDIFSYGVVLFEMLTGRRVFRRDTPVETMMAILEQSPPTFADLGVDVPPKLERIVGHCLEKEPVNRFQTTRDLSFALSGITQASPGRNPRTNHSSDSTATQTLPTALRASPSTSPSIAVLPFANMSPDPENEYFSDGLADELINALCKIDGLHVASRTSAFAFKGKNEDIREIGRRLNVRSVLEGSVRRSGNRLRITAQLVSVDNGYHLWSEVFDRELADVFAIQDEIACNIAQALEVVLSEQDKRALAHVPTTSIEAYDCYLRGRRLFHEFRRSSLEEARRQFRRACELDSEFAAAYAGVAECSSALYGYWGATDDHLVEANQASRRAFELAPDEAEVLVSRASTLALLGSYSEARQAFEKAIRLGPDSFDAYYSFARMCYQQGELEEAARLFDCASRVNADDFQAPALAATVYAGLGRKDESEEACRRALSTIKRRLELYPHDGRALYMGAIIHAHSGNHRLGREWAERAAAADPEEPLVLYNVACTYAVLGEADHAIECLKRAVELGGTWRDWIENDPDLNSLRGHPRFEAVMALF